MAKFSSGLPGLLAFSAFSALSSGCAAELAPAADAKKVDGDVAVATAGPVEIRARGGWRGEAGVLDHTTPVELTLVNSGERPVRISYSSFRLTTSSGKRYAAMPPWKIRGEAEMFVHDPQEEIYRPTRLEQDIDSPSIHTAPVPFASDTLYSDPETSYRRQKVPLPTAAMVQDALREGVIQPGQAMKGNVYFRPVSTDESRVTLDISVHDATTGEQIGLARIPFDVD